MSSHDWINQKTWPRINTFQIEIEGLHGNSMNPVCTVLKSECEDMIPVGSRIVIMGFDIDKMEAIP